MTHQEPQISVIIATSGRAEKLEKSLIGYASLAPGTPSFEVVVVLDGDDPATRETCAKPWAFPVHVLSQARSGPGPARNLGATAACGRLAVLLNDDTRPHPENLLAHAEAQSRLGPCVAIGRTEWDPEKPRTPYMRWLAPEGHQFNFGRLDPSRPVPWDACWATNLAIPKMWLDETPFDPAYPWPAVEDGEWGYRLIRSGRHLRYVPEAVCYHDHRYEGPAQYRQRARNAGAASRYLVGRHPELAWAVMGRPVIAAGVRLASLVWPGRWRRDFTWDMDFRANYVLGMLQRRRNQRFP